MLFRKTYNDQKMKPRVEKKNKRMCFMTVKANEDPFGSEMLLD